MLSIENERIIVDSWNNNIDNTVVQDDLTIVMINETRKDRRSYFKITIIHSGKEEDKAEWSKDLYGSKDPIAYINGYIYLMLNK